MKKEDKKGLLDDVDLAIEAKLQLHEVKLSGMAWTVKFTVDQTLAEIYQHYKVALSLNEQPDLDRIARIQSELKEGLFKDDKVSAENAKKSIGRIESELEKKRKLCEDIEFIASAREMKYTSGGTQIVLQIPDKIIEALNRQKTRLQLMYKVRLEPTTI